MWKTPAVFFGGLIALPIVGVLWTLTAAGYALDPDPSQCLTPQETAQAIEKDTHGKVRADGRFVQMDPAQIPAFLKATGFPFPSVVTGVTVFFPPEKTMVMVLPTTADGCVVHKTTGTAAADAEWKSGLSMVVPTALFEQILRQLAPRAGTSHGEETPDAATRGDPA